MNKIKLILPLSISCLATITVNLASCASNSLVKVKIADLFEHRYKRKTQIIQSEERKEVEEDLATFEYLNYVKNDKRILIDDIFKTIYYCSYQVISVEHSGTLGLSISDVDPNQNIISVNVIADNIVLSGSEIENTETEITIDGKASIVNLPISISYNGSSQYSFDNWLLKLYFEAFLSPDYKQPWSIDASITLTEKNDDIKQTVDLIGNFNQDIDSQKRAILKKFFDTTIGELIMKPLYCEYFLNVGVEEN